MADQKKVPMQKAESALRLAASLPKEHVSMEVCQQEWIAFGALFMLGCDCASLDGNLPELLHEVQRLRAMIPGPPTKGSMVIVPAKGIARG